MNEILITIISSGITLVAGAFGGSMWQRKRAKADALISMNEAYDKITENLRKQIDVLVEENQERNNRIVELTEKIEGLEEQIKELKEALGACKDMLSEIK